VAGDPVRQHVERELGGLRQWGGRRRRRATPGVLSLAALDHDHIGRQRALTHAHLVLGATRFRLAG
jgi:hypothetical protein